MPPDRQEIIYDLPGCGCSCGCRYAQRKEYNAAEERQVYVRGSRHADGIEVVALRPFYSARKRNSIFSSSLDCTSLKGMR